MYIYIYIPAGLQQSSRNGIFCLHGPKVRLWTVCPVTDIRSAPVCSQRHAYRGTLENLGIHFLISQKSAQTWWNAIFRALVSSHV